MYAQLPRIATVKEVNGLVGGKSELSVETVLRGKLLVVLVQCADYTFNIIFASKFTDLKENN
jgi:hypothetical protein